MKGNERYLHDKFGNQRPFRVPEGYFDSFHSRLMETIAKDEQAGGQHSDETKQAEPVVHLTVRMKPRRRLAYAGIAATLIAAFVLSATLIVNNTSSTPETVALVDSGANYADNVRIDKEAAVDQQSKSVALSAQSETEQQPEETKVVRTNSEGSPSVDRQTPPVDRRGSSVDRQGSPVDRQALSANRQSASKNVKHHEQAMAKTIDTAVDNLLIDDDDVLSYIAEY